MNKIKEQSASADFQKTRNLGRKAFTARNMNYIRGREDLNTLRGEREKSKSKDSVEEKVIRATDGII